MTRPWLSVIMPTYNGEQYLRETFESMVEQEERGFECVVVDGGSTDSTRAIIDEFSRELDVRVFVRPEFPNWVGKTNFGFGQAAAEHVCMLHSDDRWLPGRAAAVHRTLQRHPDLALLLNPSLIIDQDGRTVGRWRCPLVPEQIYSADALLEHLIVQNFVAVPAPTFRREAALAVGGIDPVLWYTGDWDFYLKLARTGSTLYLDEMLTSFRIHGASLTMKGSANVDSFRAQLETVLERHLPAIESTERRHAARRVGAVSNEIDIALAAAVHGSWSELPGAFASLAALGPAGWRSYFRDSRIVERVSSRLRARGNLFAVKKATT
jgi:glycosyltransferase involved in cell wall biosynthesis